MNTNVMFVRVMGMLVPVSEVSLVQVSPNNPKQVVQDIPLARPLEDLMEYNLNSFVHIPDNRWEWVRMLDGQKPVISERG